ncbi:hypothetical protein J7K50_02530 [bacterium]|nr:hypothetical protein [bacterium]
MNTGDYFRSNSSVLREVVRLFRESPKGNIGLPSLVVNRYLANSSNLRECDSIDSVCASILEKPQLLLSVLEIIEGNKLFGDEYIDHEEFVSRYLGQLPADVFIFAWSELEQLKSLPILGASFHYAKSRESLVYFAQNLVRYAYHFGGIQYDIGEFKRFCSYYSPGLVILNKQPSEFEAMVLHVLSFLDVTIWQVGERWLDDQKHPLVAEDELADRLLRLFKKNGWHFSSGRSTGDIDDESPLATWGGGYNSFFIIRSMGGIDGVDIRGETVSDIGLIIDIGDSDIDITMTGYLERALLEMLNSSGYLRAETREWFTLRVQPGTSLQKAGEFVYGLLKSEFDLKQVSVSVVCDPYRLSSLKPSILAYRDNRNKAIAHQDELNSSFYLCTRCRSYAKKHFCISTAEHPPHCGRSYEMIKTLAHASDSAEYIPIKKGELLDRKRGEFAGVNKIARLMSGGEITRVFLHSLKEYPHPLSAEFNILAFHIARLDGIGLIHRGYSGATPDGRSWKELESSAIGRQCDGIVAVSEGYLNSRMFLAADGGAANILWMTSNLKERLSWGDRRIATEKDCGNLTTLKNYY